MEERRIVAMLPVHLEPVCRLPHAPQAGTGFAQLYRAGGRSIKSQAIWHRGTRRRLRASLRGLAGAKKSALACPCSRRTCSTMLERLPASLPAV